MPGNEDTDYQGSMTWTSNYIESLSTDTAWCNNDDAMANIGDNYTATIASATVRLVPTVGSVSLGSACFIPSVVITKKQQLIGDGMLTGWNLVCSTFYSHV